jgi:hypothetical protein
MQSWRKAMTSKRQARQKEQKEIEAVFKKIRAERTTETKNLKTFEVKAVRGNHDMWSHCNFSPPEDNPGWLLDIQELVAELLGVSGREIEEIKLTVVINARAMQ